jgi:hypothetical protein
LRWPPQCTRSECLHPVESEIELLIPDDDVADPLLSIVVPALNERIAIAEFVEWCKAGLASAGIRGEILIVDSSTDETPGHRPGPRRARLAHAQARPRPRLYRCNPLYTR